jgi:mRNA-degrading endonuclease toxin of MazEF toxin-antitoxin module
MSDTPRRGEIWTRGVPGATSKVIIVSVNERNNAYETVVGCPVLEQVDVDVPRSVRLRDGEPVQGVVYCDLIFLIRTKELTARLGLVSEGALDEVSLQLAGALGLFL